MFNQKIPKKGVTMGGISYYYSEGELRMRQAGGPSKKQVRSRASCQGIRDSNAEFTGANAVAKLLRKGLGRFVNSYSNGSMSGRLSGMFRKVAGMGAGHRGARAIDVAASPHLLRDFEFNTVDVFGSRYRGELSVQFSEARDGAVLRLSFDPARDLVFPEGATAFQLMHTLVALPAYHTHEGFGKYVPRRAGAEVLHADVSSPLFPRSLRMRSTLSLPVWFPEGSVTEDCTLLCVVRIGFYKDGVLMKGSGMKILEVG